MFQSVNGPRREQVSLGVIHLLAQTSQLLPQLIRLAYQPFVLIRETIHLLFNFLQFALVRLLEGPTGLLGLSDGRLD